LRFVKWWEIWSTKRVRWSLWRNFALTLLARYFPSRYAHENWHAFQNALTVDQVSRVEDICNKMVASNYSVYSQEVPLHVAKSINGLRAVFGEVAIP
jgi:hypothetical protein